MLLKRVPWWMIWNLVNRVTWEHWHPKSPARRLFVQNMFKSTKKISRPCITDRLRGNPPVRVEIPKSRQNLPCSRQHFQMRFLQWKCMNFAKFFTKVRINNIPSLVQIMAWRRPGDKTLYESMLVSLLTRICVTPPQWVTRFIHVLTYADVTDINHWISTLSRVELDVIQSDGTVMWVPLRVLEYQLKHDDVIKWKHFPRYWPFVRGIHRPRWIPAQRPVTRSFEGFLAATKQLYDWFSPSVRLSVCLSVCPSVRPSHLFHHVPIIVSSWNFQELLPWSELMSMQKVKVSGQRSRSQRSTPNLAVSGL